MGIGSTIFAEESGDDSAEDDSARDEDGASSDATPTDGEATTVFRRREDRGPKEDVDANEPGDGVSTDDAERAQTKLTLPVYDDGERRDIDLDD